VAIWAHQQVSVVVRVEVQKGIAGFAPIDNQCLFVVKRRGVAEGAVMLVGLVGISDVDHAMRCPETLHLVRVADKTTLAQSFEQSVTGLCSYSLHAVFTCS
jgi:hypothetical protein